VALRRFELLARTPLQVGVERDAICMLFRKRFYLT